MSEYYKNISLNSDISHEHDYILRLKSYDLTPEDDTEPTSGEKSDSCESGKEWQS